jgi:hypothetical protein
VVVASGRADNQNGRVHLDESVDPLDLPAPPSPDEAAARFGGVVFTLSPQASLEEAFIGIGAQVHDGVEVIASATVTYTLWRNPVDRSDPANLADLSPETAWALDTEPIRELPEWLVESRERMRYPSLWEAVRTTRLSDTARLPWHSVEYELVEHVNYVITNCFREERVRGDILGELLGGVTEKAIEYGIPISVDGRDVMGMRIDTDPHVFGVAVELDDRIVTAAIARDHLSFFELRFVTRKSTS